MDWLRENLQWVSRENFWIIEAFVVVFGTLVLDFFQKRVVRRLATRLEKTKSPWDDAMLHAVRRPLSVLIWLLGLTFAADVVASQSESAIFAIVAPLREVGVIVVLAWALVRFIGFAEQNLLAQGTKEGGRIDRTTADAISKLLRVSVIITAGLVILQTLGFSISGVLAFGGIGGIAVGFAARDLLANFFGGLMIYLDRPFAVGDWVRSPDRDIEGTVEKIGWRLTCIRTFDKRPLYIPNAIFANIALQNPSRMSHRRIYETIGVRYDDIGKLPKIVAEVKAMLKSHPDIAQDQTMMVNFNAFAPSSLDFFIYTFTRTTDWQEYHEIKQDVLFRVSEIIAAQGAEIAFPTSTVHLEVEKGEPALQAD